MAEIIALCEQYKVRELCVFGSALMERFGKNSDVDFTVVFDKASIDDYFVNCCDCEILLLFPTKTI